MNKVIIIGSLGRDPEVKTTANGTVIAKLRVATSERRKERGEWREHTEWHSVTIFGRQAETAARYLAKGRQVAIEGRIQTRSWDDRKTGQKRYATEIVADRVEFVGGRGGAEPPVEGAAMQDRGQARRFSGPPAKHAPSEYERDDDIPF